MTMFLNLVFNKYFSPEAIARRLVKCVLKSVNLIFGDEEVRRLIKFQSQSPEEQKRVLGELHLSGIVLLNFILEDLLNEKNYKEKTFWRKVEKIIPQLFRSYFKKNILSGYFRYRFSRLLEARYEESYKDQRELRDVLLQRHAEGLALNKRYLRIQTIAINSLRHLRGGRAFSYDPLFKHIFIWLSSLEDKLNKMLNKSWWHWFVGKEVKDSV